MLSLLEPSVGPTKTPTGQCCRPPDPGWVTIKTDGSVNVEAMHGGARGVARSHLAFLEAWRKPLQGVTDSFIAELFTLQEGVIFAQLHGYSHVTMEVDCLELVNLCNSCNNSRSIAALILRELVPKKGNLRRWYLVLGMAVLAPGSICSWMNSKFKINTK